MGSFKVDTKTVNVEMFHYRTVKVGQVPLSSGTKYRVTRDRISR